ncbi:hypothetical protein BGW38_006781 [Lunasporangiospora selenospora]|uniref:Sphingomyelin phosphodiesterase n=1 Tax=Lunasporangiospora selenospora TaxID=979761 RepID=A0A9P6KGS4_9FUNG|nr:hypothetical protein BGW38_006781 [Lunasporangiospora selenospora]
MKFNTGILLLSAAVITVQAAPAPVHLEKRNWVIDKLKPLFLKALQTLECGACVSAIAGAREVAALNNQWVLDAAKELCPTLAKQSPEVCEGLVRLYGPPLIDTVMKANILGGDGKIMCHAMGGLCPAPAITAGTIKFPKVKPANAAAPSHSGKRVDVLHLSDWHVDDLYVPGAEAECNRPTCCRKYSDSPVKPTRAASSWGDYKCDTPIKLGKHLLDHVPKVANASFAILTGDIPPHDVWIQDKSTVRPIEIREYGTIGSLPVKVYPAVGNHESGPSSLFPTPSSGGDSSWLYAGLAQDWSRWLPTDAVNSVKNYGAYTTSPSPGFRIISLNTNFCYTVNFYLYANTRDLDPHGELKWLIQALQAAEDAGERVWIISHIGPSMTDCLQNWSAQYYQVIQRYSPHVIAEQFYGHSHYDEFALFYSSSSKNAQSALSTAWIGPSVTPYTDINPGFRVYKVDTKSWNVFDSETYIADLNQANNWDATNSGPNWHLEYSARQAYGAHVPIAADAPLSAAWWHNVTNVMEKNDAVFQQYWKYRGKSAGRLPACAAGSACIKEMICDLRAGQSVDACTKKSLNRRDLNGAETETEASADDSGIHSLYKREEPRPWKKQLCGIPELGL